jgi:hypothetical protein
MCHRNVVFIIPVKNVSYEPYQQFHTNRAQLTRTFNYFFKQVFLSIIELNLHPAFELTVTINGKFELGV